MTNASRRCQECRGCIPARAAGNRRYCSDRCRWVAVQAAKRERDRAGYNATQRAVMARARLRAKLKRQAASQDVSGFIAGLSPVESAAQFAMLLRRTAGILRLTGRDVAAEWRARLETPNPSDPK